MSIDSCMRASLATPRSAAMSSALGSLGRGWLCHGSGVRPCLDTPVLVKLIVAEIEWTQEEVCPLQTRGFSGHRESGDNNS